MPYVVTVCKSCSQLTESGFHGPEDALCEAPDGFERVELFTEREVGRAVVAALEAHARACAWWAASRL